MVSKRSRVASETPFIEQLLDFTRYEVVKLEPKDRVRLLGLGYEPIPTAADKAIYIAGWRSAEVTEKWLAENLKKWPSHLNTGVRTGHTTALDIDVTNLKILKAIIGIVVEMFGTDILSRRGNKGILIPLHCPDLFGKRSIMFTDGDKKRMGNPKGLRPDAAVKGRAASVASRMAASKAFAEKYRGIVAQIKADGVTSLSGIAKALNEKTLYPPRGGRWEAKGVKRLLGKLA